MKQTEEQFFELLRSGLWNRPADVAYFEGKTTDWDTIYRLSKEQTVMGVVYDGMITLPNKLRPEKKMKLRWYAQVGIIERKNKELNSVLVDIFARYKAQGFTPVLLKGQGVAALYPHPLHRQCGDIDVLVGEEDYEKCNEYVHTLSPECDEQENEKHYTFDFHYVTIENHHYVADIPPTWRNRTFQRLTQEWFPRTEEKMCMDGVDIALPPRSFNALFLFIHVHHHLMMEGVGLRQLCDMAIFLCQNAPLFPNVMEYIRQLKLEKEWSIYLSFFEAYLGLQLPVAVSNTKRSQKKAERLCRLILRNGNFGHADPLRQHLRTNYWLRKVQSVWLHLIHFSHLLPLFPCEVLYNTLFLFPNGIKRVAKYGT